MATAMFAHPHPHLLTCLAVAWLLMVEVGQRAGELSKQALKIFQQIANDGSSQ
jgi:hypothetical protein